MPKAARVALAVVAAAGMVTSLSWCRGSDGAPGADDVRQLPEVDLSHVQAFAQGKQSVHVAQPAGHVAQPAGPGTTPPPLPSFAHVPGIPVSSPSQVQVVPSAYLARLLELRKTYDLVPWIEPVSLGASKGVQFAAGAANGDKKTASWTPAYDVIARELVGFGADLNAVFGGVFTGLAPFALAHFSSEQQRSLGVPDPISQYLLLGSNVLRWNRFREGLMLQKGLQQNVLVQALAAVGGGHPATFYAAYRGYRLWPKGTQPQQMTWAEYAERGYALVPYPLAVSLTPGAAPSVAAVNTDLTIPVDYVVEGIRLYDTPGGIVTDPGSQEANYLAFIQHKGGGTALMRDYVSITSVGWAQKDQSWTFDIPWRLPAQTVLQFFLQKELDDGQDLAHNLTVQIILDGYQLVPPGH